MSSGDLLRATGTATTVVEPTAETVVLSAPVVGGGGVRVGRVRAGSRSVSVPVTVVKLFSVELPFLVTGSGFRECGLLLVTVCCPFVGKFDEEGTQSSHPSSRATSGGSTRSVRQGNTESKVQMVGYTFA